MNGVGNDTNVATWKFNNVQGPIDPAVGPTADEVERGWRAQLGAGARVELPDVALTRAWRRALAQTLLAAQLWNPDGRDVAALEDTAILVTIHYP